MEENLIWHYTHYDACQKILSDYELKVSEAERKQGSKPGLWFSKNQLWEPTATKMVRKGNELYKLSFSEQAELYGAYRFGMVFDRTLTNWRKYKYVSKLPEQIYYNMELVGLHQKANPNDWYVSFNNISLGRCCCVEIWKDGVWTSL